MQRFPFLQCGLMALKIDPQKSSAEKGPIILLEIRAIVPQIRWVYIQFCSSWFFISFNDIPKNKRVKYELLCQIDSSNRQELESSTIWIQKFWICTCFSNFFFVLQAFGFVTCELFSSQCVWILNYITIFCGFSPIVEQFKPRFESNNFEFAFVGKGFGFVIQIFFFS